MRANPVDAKDEDKVDAVGRLVHLMKDLRVFRKYEVHTQYINGQFFVLAWLREESDDGSASSHT